jgi:hypothetical protein
VTRRQRIRAIIGLVIAGVIVVFLLWFAATHTEQSETAAHELARKTAVA